MTAIAICGFLIAGLCGTYRILAGPTLADRVVALDVTLISLMGAITVDAARRDDPTNLVLLVVLAIIGFTATVATSQFIEADREPEDESQDAPQPEAGPYEDPKPEPGADDQGGTDRGTGQEIQP